MTSATDIPHSLAWRAKNAEKYVWSAGSTRMDYASMQDSHFLHSAIMVMKGALVRTAEQTLVRHNKDLESWYENYHDDAGIVPGATDVMTKYFGLFAGGRCNGYRTPPSEKTYLELASNPKYVDLGERLGDSGCAATASLILMLMDYFEQNPLKLAPEAEFMLRYARSHRSKNVAVAVEMIFHDLKLHWAMVMELLFTDRLHWVEYGDE